MFERCLYFNINALARRINSIWEEAFSEFGLSPAHSYLLRLILEKPGLTQTQITSELQLEKSTVTRFVTVLENKEFLSRDRQGREARVYPTAKAYSIQNKLSTRGDELYQKVIDKLGKAKVKELVESLRETGKRLNKKFSFDKNKID